MTLAGADPDLADRAAAVIPGGVNSGNRWAPGLAPMVVTGASGARFRDGHGRWLVDYHGAGGPTVLGHCEPRVDRAAAAAATGVDLVGVGCTELEVTLAERIAAEVPSAERVLLTTSGSEATYHALRLARAATGRRLIVKFEGGYHGWHDAVALNLFTPRELIGSNVPLSAGSMPAVTDATVVLPFNDTEAVGAAFARHSGEIAAVIVEPVAHNVGALLPVPGFLEALRAVTAAAGAVLVFDEVVTGFRHGLGGYQRRCGVTPDLTTLGKALANGYPLGALAGRADLMDRFSTTTHGDVLFAGTYNAHPASVAAAIATLDVLAGEPVHEHLFQLGAAARAGLAEVYADLGIPAVTTGLGSVFVTYFMDRPARSYTDLLAGHERRFVAERLALLEFGIFQFPRNLKRNHISYAHTGRDIDQLLDATRAAAARVTTDLEREHHGTR